MHNLRIQQFMFCMSRIEKGMKKWRQIGTDERDTSSPKNLSHQIHTDVRDTHSTELRAFFLSFLKQRIERVRSENPMPRK